MPSYAEKNVQINVKPMSCHVKTFGDVCHAKLHVSWQSAEKINPCLFKNNIKEICWYEQQGSEITLDTSFDKNLLFTLKQDNKVLAQQTVTISSEAPKYRRRLRADWSIF